MILFSSSVHAHLDLGMALLTGHLLGDFVPQPSGMVKNKRRPGALLLHVLVVTAATYVCAGRWQNAWLPLAIFVTHGLIDWLKVRIGKGGQTAFVVDQLAHLAVIAALTAGAGEFAGDSMWSTWWGPIWWAVLVFVSTFILAVRVGGMLIGYWVQPYLDEIQRSAHTQDIAFRPTRGLTNGGRVIGQWERALIFVFVGLGQPTAIGFLIAAKSIFRFGELKDRENRMEAEYITIGTLMSFGWALACSYAGWWVLRSLL